MAEETKSSPQTTIVSFCKQIQTNYKKFQEEHAKKIDILVDSFKDKCSEFEDLLEEPDEDPKQINANAEINPIKKLMIEKIKERGGEFEERFKQYQKRQDDCEEEFRMFMKMFLFKASEELKDIDNHTPDKICKCKKKDEEEWKGHIIECIQKAKCNPIKESN